MQTLILIGVKYGSGGKEVVNLYTGLNGIDLQEAADKAAATNEYAQIGKIVNPACTPMPIVSGLVKRTTPSFPRPKAVEQPKIKRNPLDDINDKALQQRKARLEPALSGDAQQPPEKSDSEKSAESEQPKENKHQGGSQVEAQSFNSLRQDGPTLEEFEAAGYKAELYPPKGFAEKPSKRLEEYRASQKTTSATEAPAKTVPEAKKAEASSADSTAPSAKSKK